MVVFDPRGNFDESFCLVVHYCFASGSETTLPLHGTCEEGARVKSPSTEDWEGSGRQSEDPQPKVHAAGTAQNHQEGTGTGKG